MDLIDRVRRFIRDHALADPQTSVVAAVSGGSDSVALAHIIHELDQRGELRAAGLAHFNHQLRAAADDDERFCVSLAESFGWSICVDREDVAARARRSRSSLETAARTARHAFFERARSALSADVVAVAHTRDDQAETFLLRLLRGAGPRGLAAMHPRHAGIVRPLLCCRRGELREHLSARRASYVEDETNLDRSIPRNRVRAELLPLLAQRFNPRIVDALANEAELAGEAWECLRAASERLIEVASRRDGDPAAGFATALDVKRLNEAARAVRRVALWRSMVQTAGGKTVSFQHVQDVLRLVETDARGPIDLPGQRVERVGGEVVLKSRTGAGDASLSEPNLFDYPLSIPGEVLLPLAGGVLSAETLSEWPAAESAAGRSREVALVRRDLCGARLRVRNRRPGDRFRPVGLGGRKKLQDFFVDRKVARDRRDAVPLVVDAEGRIVWVAGFGIDETFRVTDPAQGVVVLRLKLLGGPA